MADIEKVIQGIEVCLQDDGCVPCPYYRKGNDYFCGVTDIMRDALELLKEQQEEVEPHHKCIGETYSLITESHVTYCPWCGKKIKRITD